MPGRVWITWERQRRSRVLAEHFGCSFEEIVEKGLLRYPKSISRTLRVLMRDRPDTLFVQNPSMILAAVAVLWGLVTSTFVIVDRHSTFLLNRDYRLSPWLIVFKTLNRFTLRFADLTIVTNQFLADLVERYGGRPYILPDKLPELDAFRDEPYPVEEHARNVFLISSFAHDEPIRDVFESLSLVSEQPIHLYVSGNPARAPADLVEAAPSNVTFTGYLSDEDFNRLLCTADLVAVLTTADHTMLCGCYEAVAADRPLITSDKKVLRDYFKGAFFVDNSPDSIARVLRLPEREIQEGATRIRELKSELHRSWGEQAEELTTLIAAKA